MVSASPDHDSRILRLLVASRWGRRDRQRLTRCTFSKLSSFAAGISWFEFKDYKAAMARAPNHTSASSSTPVQMTEERNKRQNRV